MNKQLFFIGKRLLASFFLFVLISCPIQAEPSIRLQVDAALMGVQPLKKIRRISTLSKSQLESEEIAVEANKQLGYDEVIRIKFDPPLNFHGVISTEVILAFDAPYENFHGLVYGLFSGDINTFVNQNGLKIGTPLNTPAVGVYNRPLDERSGCPITLGATRIQIITATPMVHRREEANCRFWYASSRQRNKAEHHEIPAVDRRTTIPDRLPS